MSNRERHFSNADDFNEDDEDHPRGRKKQTLRDFHRNGNHKHAFYELDEDAEIATSDTSYRKRR